MFKGLVTAAAAVALSATPVMAAAANPASALSLRAGAELQDENELAGGILAAIVGVAVAAMVVVAVTDDDDDEELPVSA
jgi:glycerol uptake facilitator-like aquaporin